jgi:hypothetical protein
MDPTETLVSEHLAHRGYTNVVYEPDGNIPPDFLVDDVIAIEVRRLNQNHFDGSDAKGLEKVAIPLWKKIKQLVGSLGAPVGGESWFVYFRFTRPVESWKTLEPALCNALQVFMQSVNKHKGTIAKGKGFELDVFRASKAHASMFVMGGCSDEESGGWLLSEMEMNIRHCASEKSRKVAKVRPKYPQWWLALVDHIGYGLDNFDREMFRDQVSIEHDWDKILIIDPRDYRRWFEI